MSNLPKCYTSKETAEKLNSTEETLCRLRLKGLGPAYIRLGGRIIYTEESIRDFLKSGSNAQADR
jgi:hypothetical protein